MPGSPSSFLCPYLGSRLHLTNTSFCLTNSASHLTNSALHRQTRRLSVSPWVAQKWWGLFLVGYAWVLFPIPRWGPGNPLVNIKWRCPFLVGCALVLFSIPRRLLGSQSQGPIFQNQVPFQQHNGQLSSTKGQFSSTRDNSSLQGPFYPGIGADSKGHIVRTRCHFFRSR